MLDGLRQRSRQVRASLAVATLAASSFRALLVREVPLPNRAQGVDTRLGRFASLRIWRRVVSSCPEADPLLQ